MENYGRSELFVNYLENPREKCSRFRGKIPCKNESCKIIAFIYDNLKCNRDQSALY